MWAMDWAHPEEQIVPWNEVKPLSAGKWGRPHTYSERSREVQYSTVQHNTTRQYCTVQYSTVQYSKHGESNLRLKGRLDHSKRKEFANQFLNDSARNYASLDKIYHYIFSILKYMYRYRNYIFSILLNIYIGIEIIDGISSYMLYIATLAQNILLYINYKLNI
jgi:hypothetical protein